MTEPPRGFARHFRQSPLTDPWEPLWSMRDGDSFILALEIAATHTNSRGLAHGGLIAALADNAMGLACVLATEGLGGVVTVNLSVDLIGSARIGDWIEFRARPVRVGRTLAFAECQVTTPDRLIARASAVFSVPRTEAPVRPD
ncbi:MAG: PaaI family thioesterase [Sphingomonas sp.]|nr:PaaI family thioesterase [Sphingomonas sp.]